MRGKLELLTHVVPRDPNGPFLVVHHVYIDDYNKIEVGVVEHYMKGQKDPTDPKGERVIKERTVDSFQLVTGRNAAEIKKALLDLERLLKTNIDERNKD